eukprot:TRINITY_DN2193_c0_g1_i7.p1 TRINITY_DN2193_c0_g1~~TRINITY_DN2193_c0_g1_i7.p1  ORF type:complete len:497 (-),score=88.40 TRINITY_DN2193_c0_g1_i7:4-1494(-)
MAGQLSSVLRGVLLGASVVLVCALYFLSSAGSSTTGISGPLTSLKQRVDLQKTLRREYLKLLGDQLDEAQDQRIQEFEDTIAHQQPNTNPKLNTAQRAPAPAPAPAPQRLEPPPRLVLRPETPASAARAAQVQTPAPATDGSDWLLHRAEVSGIDAVVGFAAYPRNVLGLFRSFVEPLRAGGYQGHILIGCRRELDPDEMSFLKQMNVTAYAIDLVRCDLPWTKSDTSNKGFESESERIRGVCVKTYPMLKMEWARFQLAADWLKECPTCTGWNLVTDFRDVTFQTGEPFKILDQYKGQYDLLLVEEWAGSPHGMSNEHWFSWASFHTCFGAIKGEQIVKPYKPKPVVCSGTILGSQQGIQDYASVMTAEFMSLIKLGEKCVAPHVVDQAVHIRLYYEGRFGPKATALKYGEGPVLTVGGACANATHHSMDDVLIHDKDGFVLNNDRTRAPVVHQYDRCHDNYWPLVQDLKRFVEVVRKGANPPGSEPVAALWTPP